MWDVLPTTYNHNLMLRTLLSLAAAIPLAVFGLPWCAVLLAQTWTSHLGHAGNIWPVHPLAAGLGTLISVALMLWKKPNWFIHTTIHEFCHLLACLMLLVRPHSFSTSNGDGGAVTYQHCDPLRDTLIALAPYTMPLVLTAALLIRRFVPGDAPWPALATGFAAFAYFHHLQGLYHNVRLNFWGKETDLARAGRPLSLVLISGVLMLVTAWTMHEMWTEPLR